MLILAPQTTGERTIWRVIAIVSLLPAAAYLLLLALTLVLNDSEPARWLLGDMLEGPWAIPLFWLLVVGGPILAVIGNLILQLSPKPGHSGIGVFGLIAWIMLVLCVVTCLPFPWLLFVIAAD